MQCATCGRDNPAGNRFCTFCGGGLAPAAPPAPSEALSQERSGAAAALMVFILCAVISCIVWLPLSLPSRAINAFLPDVGCSGVTPGTFLMYLCSAGVGLKVIAVPVALMVLIVLLRKPLARWVQGLTPKLPVGSRFLVAPALATAIFVLAWAGSHYVVTLQVGLLPQIIFPSVIGLFTFAVARFGPSIQRSLGSFFDFRDKFPRWMCLVAAIAIPIVISLVITHQERVTFAPQKEQFIVLVALITGFLAITPHSGALSSGTRQNIPRVAAKARGARSAAVRNVGLSAGAAVLLYLLRDLFFTGVVLAHDCSCQADCIETSGYQGATGVGGGVMGVAAGAIGSSLGGSAAGGAVTTGAGPVTGPAQGTTPPPSPPTRILDGDAAIDWLKDRGMLDDDGLFTDKFQDWSNQLPGDPDRSDLEGIAMDTPDPQNPNKPGDNIVIVVPDRGEPPTPQLPEKPPEEVKKPPEEVKKPPEEVKKPPEEVKKPPEEVKKPPEEVKKPPEEVKKPPEEVKKPPEEKPKPPRPPLKPAEEPKPPGAETLKTVSDVASRIKDASDKVQKELNNLPISDDAKKKIKDRVKGWGDKAGKVKDYADKGLEYINTLDKNLQETDKLGISKESQDFLGWWRVTFKAAGELTEKFVDGATKPFTSLFGKKAEDVSKFIHKVVPVKEFGDELSKIPTSAAKTIIKAQHRDAEGIDDIINEIYPRDWSKVKPH